MQSKDELPLHVALIHPAAVNPCFGIWIRKAGMRRWTDSWGDHLEGDQYWSTFGDYDADTDVVHLTPYHDRTRPGLTDLYMKSKFVKERFEFLGRGE